MSAPARVDVLERLGELTDGHARRAGDDDAVDGVPAGWVASPADTAETSAVLRFASQAGLAVVPRGTGSKLRWGAPPERVDVVLDTTRLDTLRRSPGGPPVEHSAGDLIVVAAAGRRLADLQQDLADAGQWLAVDPARRGTLGGLVATASMGPTRFGHGPVRDLLIGSPMVRADGVVARSGGKVVKNVAGYDIGKVLTGSFGTLGVLTEVAFRLHPVPDARAWVSVPVRSPEEVRETVQRLVHSHLVPSAVELDRPAPGEGTMAVLVEGIAPGVAARSDDAVRLLGSEATADDRPPPWWGAEPSPADRPDDTGGDEGQVGQGEEGGEERTPALLKVTSELTGVAALLHAVDDAAEATGSRAYVRGSVGVGTVHLALESPAGGIPEVVAALRGRASSFGGTVVVLDADADTKRQLDVWGPVGGLEVMRSLKNQFDPDRLLAPGRFVGGI